MSDRTSFDVKIYSPRWGTNDVYEFRLERDKMTIGRKGGTNPSVCTWIEGHDPEWSTDFPQLLNINPVERTLDNDSIYPPSIFVSALESAWKYWRNSELDNDQVATEIGALIEWLNIVSKNKPKTDFWRRIF